MRELARVFGKKTLLLLALLGALNLVLFLLYADPEKQITQTGEELEWYLQRYPEFLRSTEKNSQMMSVLNMYKTGFAAESLKKTGERYRGLRETEVTFGDNRGIVLLIQYRLSDLFLLLFLFLIVMEFLAERKKGLAAMVRSTVRGRSILFLQRMGVLLTAAFLGALVFYGSDFVGVEFSFGMDQLGRSLQSLPEFQKCPFSMTIGEYLLAAFGLKVYGCFTIAVLFYTLAGGLEPIFAYAISGFFLAAEYALGILIAPISAWNPLRYINVFTLIRAEDFFTDCVYLNIMGRAVLGITFLIGFVGSLLVLFLFLGFWMHGKGYAVQSRTGERLLDWIARIRERISFQHTLFGWEMYKLIIRQGGIVIMAAVFLVHLSISSQYHYLLPVDTFEQLYYIRFHGELTRDTLEDANQIKDNLLTSRQTFEKVLNGMEEKGNYNPEQYQRTYMALQQNLMEQASLEVVLEDIRSGMEYSERMGKTLTVTEPYIYYMLLNLDAKTKTRASFLVLVGVIGSVGGIFAFERQSHMQQWIHTAYRGRGRNTMCKIGVLLLLCAGIAIFIHSVQLLRIGADMGTGYQDLNVPVQSLKFMRDFPLAVSIRGYLILLFGLRALVACMVGLGTATISSRCSDRVTAMGAAAFLVLLLVVAAEVVPGCRWMNPVYLMNGEYFR